MVPWGREFDRLVGALALALVLVGAYGVRQHEESVHVREFDVGVAAFEELVLPPVFVHFVGWFALRR